LVKDGKDLPRVIRTIETALAAGDKRVKVEMPKMLPDKVTSRRCGHPRETPRNFALFI
jgi:hypothetical protein